MNIFDKAKAYIEQGWCKQVLEDMSGNVCALGALNKAKHSNALSHRGEWDDPERRMLDSVMTELFPEQAASTEWCKSVPGYATATINNHPDITKEDVLAAFEKASVRADEKGLFQMSD